MTASNIKSDTTQAVPAPLFLLGMPRSGTKLLRDLLNKHPLIHIPEIETNFLQIWIDEVPSMGDLSNRDAFSRFYQYATKMPHFIITEKHGKMPTEDNWFAICSTYDIPGLFEGLIRSEMHVDSDKSMIWGDKSPIYTNYWNRIGPFFPGAKVINIYRDARDQALSVKKAWGSSMLRASQSWANHVMTPRRAMAGRPDLLHELKYEDLIENPEQELKAICDFLQIEFSDSLLSHFVSTEKRGEASGFAGIKSDNKKKYLSHMSPSTATTIEQITTEGLREIGYPTDYSGPPRRLSNWQLKLLRLRDALPNIWSRRKEHGLIGATLLLFRGLGMKR